jgi:hypothetical protein
MDHGEMITPSPMAHFACVDGPGFRTEDETQRAEYTGIPI